MLVRYKWVMAGPGPSEAVILVDTLAGPEEVIVDMTILKEGSVDVGEAITRRNEAVLVELPREASSGRMRAWVHEDNIIKDSIAA